MPLKTNRKWDRNSTFAEAQKYKTRGQFGTESAVAYQWLSKRGLLSEACKHMPVPNNSERVKWTLSKALAEADKYTQLSDFCSNSRKAYRWLKRRGLLEGACGHMFRSTTGWSRSQFIDDEPETNAIFYIIRCDGDANEVFAKYGITRRTVAQRFPHKQALPYLWEVKHETVLPRGQIWDLEREFRRQVLYRGVEYSPSIDFGGRTECFEYGAFGNNFEEMLSDAKSKAGIA